MSASVPFGLYPSRSLVTAQRINAGRVFDLNVPVKTNDVVLFRTSLWLPVPATCRGATALRLAASSLRLRFAAASYDVVTGSTDWFTRSMTSGNQEVRLDFVWPATITRIQSPTGYGAMAMKLHRADGEQTIEDATQTGATGTTLFPPWIGSPLVIILDNPIIPKHKIMKDDNAQATIHMKSKAMPRAAGNTTGGISELKQEINDKTNVLALLTQVQQSDIIPAITIAGKPTSPRLRLSLEALGTTPESLLWQGILPGEQGIVDLPAKEVTEEWGPACEQILKALNAPEAPAGSPAVLRLDIESDAPCSVSLQQASLTLEADFTLLPAPLKFDFDGSRHITHTIELPLPAVGTPTSLKLEGRVDGAAGAASGTAALPAGGRTGVLLATDESAVRRITLATPSSLAGVTIGWHPLSDQLALKVRILADGGNAPAARALLDQSIEIDTPATGWIALRWPQIDLQTQTLWLQITVTAGSGVWLADPAQPPEPGWHESIATPTPKRTPFSVCPLYEWLLATEESASNSPGLKFSAGAQLLTPSLEKDALALTISGPALANLATSPVRISSGVAAKLSIASAHVSVQIS